MELEQFKTVVVPLRINLQGIAENILSNKDDAEDAVQETFLRLWNVRNQLKGHPNVNGFAVKTLKNICIDKLRAKHTNVSLEKIQIEEQSIAPDIYTEQNDSVSIIRKIIQTLPELQRQTIQMRDIEGYELEEIAQITASEVTAVRVNLSRARKKVRDKFVSINKVALGNNGQQY